MQRMSCIACLLLLLPFAPATMASPLLPVLLHGAAPNTQGKSSDRAAVVLTESECAHGVHTSAGRHAKSNAAVPVRQSAARSHTC